MDKSLYKKILEDKSDMLWFVLGSIISADALISTEACNESLAILNGLREALNDLEIDKERHDRIVSFLDDAEGIIKTDLDNMLGN